MDVRLALLAVCLCFSQCRQQGNAPTPTELTIKFVDELRPQLVGTWEIRQAQVSHKNLVPVYYSTGITKDTLLQDVATLNLWPSSEKQIDGRILELEGTLQFRATEYPIKAKLWPRQNDPKSKGTLFLNFAYKESGVTLIPQEVDYLQSIGLIGDNFSVETVLGEPTMTWRGLNRAIISASFYRK
ncbi:hypothetical protein GCM10028808_32000 [Spirosoma migulaei]